jgi:hypothetical protein
VSSSNAKTHAHISFGVAIFRRGQKFGHLPPFLFLQETVAIHQCGGRGYCESRTLATTAQALMQKQKATTQVILTLSFKF